MADEKSCGAIVYTYEKGVRKYVIIRIHVTMSVRSAYPFVRTVRLYRQEGFKDG